MSSTPLLVAAAILVVYIVLGMLYESYIHPITILSSLPSAGVGALLMLMWWPSIGDLFWYLGHGDFDALIAQKWIKPGYDLSVIAMIGVILLIGIVKKNAIMMIDFALQAERLEGKSPREAIHQACLLRFRPIMMTTFAALFGAYADRDRSGGRLGTAPPARCRDRRRIAGLAVADALHDAGHLSLSGTLGALARAPLQAVACAGSSFECPETSPCAGW